MLLRIETVQLKQSDSIIEIGRGVQEIAKAQSRWFGLFEREMGPGDTHTIRPEDEWRDAEKRARDEVRRLTEEGFPVGLSAREQVDAMWMMQQPDET